MNWDDIDDCEGCRKESPRRRSALTRLADKLGGPKTSSTLARLTRVTVPPYDRINPKTGHLEHVDGYTYTRHGSAPSLPSGGSSRSSVPGGDRPKGAAAAPTAALRQKVNTPTPVAKLKGKAAKKAAKVLTREKANIPKGASLKVEPPKNIPNIPGVALKVTSGDGTKENPFQTSDVETAAALIGPQGNKSYVQLTQERKVSTLLDRVKALVDDAKAKGEEAPLYDLCKVTVPGTNLFCIDNKEIPRVNMPQLTSDHPDPGSEADKMERDELGEVNLSELFERHLVEDLGMNVQEEDVDPSFLRATQNELNGAKVAKLAGKIAEGGYKRDKPIFVTNDDYIVDGHHRWAGAIGAEYKQGADIIMPVRRVDADILTVLREAVEWTTKMGIPPEAASQAAESRV